jgi:hypothetical protein
MQDLQKVYVIHYIRPYAYSDAAPLGVFLTKEEATDKLESWLDRIKSTWTKTGKDYDTEHVIYTVRIKEHEVYIYIEPIPFGKIDADFVR